MPPPRMLFCTTDLRLGIECFRNFEIRLAMLFWKIINETCSFGHVSASLVRVCALWSHSNCVICGNRPGGKVMSFAPCFFRRPLSVLCCLLPPMISMFLTGLSVFVAAFVAARMYLFVMCVGAPRRLITPYFFLSSCSLGCAFLKALCGGYMSCIDVYAMGDASIISP